MKTHVAIALSLLLLSCGQNFKVKDQIPSDPPTLEARVEEIKKAYLVKELDFSSTEGLLNGTTVLDGVATLTNPHDEAQYINTGVSISDYSSSTISVWFKTNEPQKVQHLFWQGYAGANGWGNGSYNAAYSEFHITLNHSSDTSGTIISAFLGYNEQAVAPNDLPVCFPKIWGQPGLTGPTVVLDTNWHHMIVTIKRVAAHMEVTTFYDGEKLQTGVGSQMDTTAWGSSLIVGKPGSNNTRNFTGQLKDLIILKAAVTEEEAAYIYKLGALKQ